MYKIYGGLPGGSIGEESTCNAGVPGLILGLGSSIKRRSTFPALPFPSSTGSHFIPPGTSGSVGRPFGLPSSWHLVGSGSAAPQYPATTGQPLQQNTSSPEVSGVPRQRNPILNGCRGSEFPEKAEPEIRKDHGHPLARNTNTGGHISQ